jgi:hypothetical protein
MTARERTVIRAVIRALRGDGYTTLEALMTAYGVQYRHNRLIKENVAVMLIALIEASNDRA